MTFQRRPHRSYTPIPSVINPTGRRLFCFEIPEHPEHYAAFWGAMENLAEFVNWGHPRSAESFAVADVWREVVDNNRARFLEMAGCGSPEACEDGDCVEFLPASPFITYAPNDPFRTPDYTPVPYVVPPWYTNPGIPLPGVLPTDAIVNFLGIVAFGDLIGIAQTGFPSCRIHFSGEGEVEIEFVRLPQGGWAWVRIDGSPIGAVIVELDTLAVTGIDLIGDIIESVVEGAIVATEVVELDIVGAGNHFIDVTFFPQIAPDVIIGFGGGIRRVSFCGVDQQGITQAPMFRVIDCILEWRPNDLSNWLALQDLTECTIPGETGPQGPQGEQGIQGPQGIQGIPGIQGDAGRDGRDGIAAEWCEVVDFRVESSAEIVIGEWSNGNGYVGVLDGDDTTLELLINFARPITITDFKLPFAVSQETVCEVDFGYEDDLGIDDDHEQQSGVWDFADAFMVRWQGCETGVSWLRIRANSPQPDGAIQLQGMSYCGKNPHVALFAPIPAPHDCIETQTFQVGPNGEIGDYPDYRVIHGTWSLGSEAIEATPFDTDDWGREVEVEIPLWCPTETIFIHFRGTHPNPEPHIVAVRGLIYDEFGNILDTYFEGFVPLDITQGIWGLTFQLGGVIPAYVNIRVSFDAVEGGNNLGQRFLDLLDVAFV